MKKQILFVAMFTLVLIFGGSVKSFGQLLPGVTGGATPNPIDPIACATSATALNPVPGVPFTYAMTNGAGEASANWTWYATKNQSFITPGTPPLLNIATQLTVASNDLLSGTSAGYGADNRGAGTVATPNGTPTVTIEWSSAILAGTTYQGDGVAPNGTPTFVVGYSENEAYCTDNLQVFEINPQPNFTIDIAAIDAAGVTLDWGIDTEERCVDNVQGAVYNTTSHELDMDYGTNTIYYEVAAANFVTNFAPQFRVLSGLNTTQTAVITIYDSYADATAAAGVPLWTSATITSTDVTNATDFRAALGLGAVNAPDVATGVSFFVKVVIDNNTEESLALNPFILAVDAQDNVVAGTGVATGTSIWDMEDADCPTLADGADQIDNSTIIITPRPTLNMNPDPATTGEPGGAAPNDHIIKTN